MWHTHRFSVPHTNRTVYEPKLWLHALTEPPPFLHEDDWDLVEHLRCHGQFASGAIANPHESIFDRPIFTRSSAPAIDGNVNERIANEIAEQRKMRKQLRAEQKRAAIEAELEVFRARARAKARQEQRMAEDARDREAEQLAWQRKQEQRRRDKEWEAAERRKQAELFREQAQNKKVLLAQSKGRIYRFVKGDGENIYIHEDECYHLTTHPDGTFDMIRLRDGQSL